MDVSNTVGGGVFDPGKLNTHVDVHASGGVFDPGKLSALVLTTVDLEGVSSLRVDADASNTLSLHSSLDDTGTGTYAGSISSSTGICEFIREAIFADSANWKLILCATSFAAIVSWVNMDLNVGLELGGSSKVYTDAKVVIDQTTCKRLSRGARWSTGRSVMMRYGIGAGAVGMLKCSRKSVII